MLSPLSVFEYILSQFFTIIHKMVITFVILIAFFYSELYNEAG